MRWTCPKCGKDGHCNGDHVNFGYQRHVPVYECFCGARWYDQPTDVEIAGILLKAGRWQENGEGGWRPEGTIQVVDEQCVT